MAVYYLFSKTTSDCTPLQCRKRREVELRMARRSVINDFDRTKKSILSDKSSVFPQAGFTFDSNPSSSSNREMVTFTSRCYCWVINLSLLSIEEKNLQAIYFSELEDYEIPAWVFYVDHFLLLVVPYTSRSNHLQKFPVQGNGTLFVQNALMKSILFPFIILHTPLHTGAFSQEKKQVNSCTLPVPVCKVNTMQE